MQMREYAQSTFPYYIPTELPPDDHYRSVLTVVENGKGVLDVDTTKGCKLGMLAYPNGGCYGECYANKTAHQYGIDFSVSVSRKIMGREHRGTLVRLLNTYPELFESVGFRTYLKMSGFHYMVHGQDVDIRMKILAHITMCNVWDSTKGTWLKLKKEWKERIEQAGIAQDISNPMYATRDGCWQGTNGFANVVTGHSHNGNASVLDSVACEVILRFFMPMVGRRVYNPFGGGVQFGYVAGSYGYEYIASEIRFNQCDANNKLCREFPGVRWVQGDSSMYEPEGMFDLVFSCPPYYKVEKYIDYDGNPPDGEINSLDTYEKFRGALFSGYRIAIDHLNDNCFFVVMTGDSRDKNGAYYCSESETELFFKENGLSVYNKIIYLEGEFTRLAHAKKTLNMRKFPKREQKIIVAYKGDISKIKDLYPPIGRL